MTTVNSILVDAFEDIVVQADESAIEGSEARTAIRTLNLMMSRFDAIGINLGWTTVTKLDDVVTIPEGSVLPVVSLLALRLWPKYRRDDISPLIISNARDGLKTLIFLTSRPSEMNYPDTLPVGSGNMYDNTYRNDAFYPLDADSILTEFTGRIALEDDTET